jgi:S1-C subfamily serine protease
MSDTTNPLASLSSAIAATAAAVAPAIVSVQSRRSRSSGFLWKSGLVVTAEEVLPDDGDFTVRLSDGAVVSANVAGRDHTTDIALLRLDGRNLAPAKLTPVVPPFGSLALVVATDREQPAAALGLVSVSGERWRSLRGGDIDARIELDVRLRHDHQGGLVLNAAGEAIGMAVRGARRRVLVIPAATIDRVAPTLERRGRIPRGYLGLALQPVRLEGDDVGAMVMSVDPAGPSAAAGLRQGDIIVGRNGDKLTGVRALLRTLGPDSIGSVTEFAVTRGGDPLQVKVTVAERPET